MNSKPDKTTCLFRLSTENSDKQPEIQCVVLQNSVTIGRAESNTVVLSESSAVSRNHCVLKRDKDGDWTVTDLRSANGVYVNSCRIAATVPHVLHDRDVLEIGRDGAKRTTAYKFQFFLQANVVVQDANSNVPRRGTKRGPPRQVCASPSMLLRDKIRQQERRIRLEMESKTAELSQLLDEANRKKEQALKEQQEREELLRSQEQDYKNKMADIELKLTAKETELDSLLKSQGSHIRNFEEKLQRVEEELTEQLKKQQEEKTKLEELERERLAQLVETQKQLETKEQQVEDVSTRLLEEMEAKVREARTKLEEEKKRHETERESLREILTTQFLDREEKIKHEIEEKEKTLTEERTELELQLKLQLEDREKLEAAAQEEREREAKRLADVEKKSRVELVASLEDIVESELVCAICSELFVQSTSLNCSHSFCALCIDKWMAKKEECPNCRKAVTSRVRSIVLDNYIERVMDMLSDDMKTRRAEVIQDRKEEQETWEKSKHQASPPAPPPPDINHHHAFLPQPHRQQPRQQPNQRQQQQPTQRQQQPIQQRQQQPMQRRQQQPTRRPQSTQQQQPVQQRQQQQPTQRRQHQPQHPPQHLPQNPQHQQQAGATGGAANQATGTSNTTNRAADPTNGYISPSALFMTPEQRLPQEGYHGLYLEPPTRQAMDLEPWQLPIFGANYHMGPYNHANYHANAGRRPANRPQWRF